MLRVRKNLISLTASEKANLVAAIKALKANGKYDQYINEHNAAMAMATLMPGETGDASTRNVAHRGPAFGPWHREMLRRFELDLQAAVPGVTLPYWDWSADAALADPKSAPVWGADLMGGDGDPANAGQVATGPFRYDPADPSSWRIVIDPGDPGPGLRRTLGTGAASLPSQSDVDAVRAVTPYDSAPWRTTSDPSFRNQLEGWSGPNLHNRVHLWVGGSMLPGTSPNDPVFFLHHCNVDRLWWQWQLAHPDAGYLPTAAGPPGHQLNDQMTPWDPANTPASTLDIHRLGYRYDTDPAMQISFLLDQATFGQDEVELQLPGVATFAAGWIAVDGFTPSDLGLDSANLGSPPAASTPTITFTLDPSLTGPQAAAITSMLAQPVFAGPVIPQDPSLPDVPQRFLFPFHIDFSSDVGFARMAADGLESTDVTLTASMSPAAGTFSAGAQIELTTGEDPRFVDIDPQHPTQYPSWLSFDLRFFKMAVAPGATAGRFGANITGAADAPAFIAGVIENLTNANGNVAGDSFDAGLTQDEEATKLEFQVQDNTGADVFNFAVARVRLSAKSTTPAMKVRVFFRLFQAQNTVSSFNEVSTYRYWTDGVPFGTTIPLAGVQNAGGTLEYVTIPCFATPRITLTDPTKSMADQTDAPNARDLATDPGHEKDYYFGCWIDNNQTAGVLPISLPAGGLPAPGQRSQPLDGPWGPGVALGSMKDAMTAFPHQCLIAEIRYDDTRIPVGATTSTSDKLAQRNIAWVDGPNPGAPSSRRMSHPVQIRPTSTASANPDELMILWGSTPRGATAQLFLPTISAATVVGLAERRLGSNRLVEVDPHTVGCPTGGATFIPLPGGTGLAAGLLAVDLPEGVRKGDLYTIDIRQVTNASGVVAAPPPPPRVTAAVRSRRQPAGAVTRDLRWRQVEGAVQFKIAISTKQQLLLSEQRLLAVLLWMKARTPTAKRWYPVLDRYVDDVAGRVEGFGGDPSSIGPSPTGHVPGWPPREPEPEPGAGTHERCDAGETEVTGKVEAIVYDHFGDFDGFVVEDCSGSRHRYYSRALAVLAVVDRAWVARTTVTVHSEPHRPDVPRSIATRVDPPRPSCGCCAECHCGADCRCTSDSRCCPQCRCAH